MKQSVKLWLEALRSGKYKQTTGMLHELDDEQGRTIGFCCLGVACEIYIATGHKLRRERKARRVFYEGVSSCLPDDVQNWLGLHDTYGKWAGGDLAAENDSGASFAEIADLIESNPPGLFVKAAAKRTRVLR